MLIERIAMISAPVLLTIIGWLVIRLFQTIDRRLDSIEGILHKTPCGDLSNLTGRFNERVNAEKHLLEALQFQQSILERFKKEE